MNPIAESLTRGVEQLLGRASGPLHFRLILQPIVATALAIRAGLRCPRGELSLLLDRAHKSFSKTIVDPFGLEGRWKPVHHRCRARLHLPNICVRSLLSGPDANCVRMRGLRAIYLAARSSHENRSRFRKTSNSVGKSGLSLAM